MKFSMQDEPDLNVVRAVGPHSLRVRDHDIRRSVILTAEQIVFDWPPANALAITPEHIAAALALDPDVIVLGTGERQQFPDPAVTRAVHAAGVGFEVMDTRAACRTYNVLVQEGRRVAAAIVIEEEGRGGEPA